MKFHSTPIGDIWPSGKWKLRLEYLRPAVSEHRVAEPVAQPDAKDGRDPRIDRRTFAIEAGPDRRGDEREEDREQRDHVVDRRVAATCWLCRWHVDADQVAEAMACEIPQIAIALDEPVGFRQEVERKRGD
jgi:hypothetical protein